MISYHFTGIIFIDGFITLISTHNIHVIKKISQLDYIKSRISKNVQWEQNACMSF